MIRPVLTELALFLTPFALYAVFLLATRQGVIDPGAWRLPVVGWLTLAALALMIASLVVMAEFSGAPPNSTYVPAHMEDGRFVPGTTR
ncbi:DUF6111 family protein [Rhodoplanes sp. TEM]|uniref:DUF6111 family protein n=1 Tax=Rhodoplanes tepidamans TaxID=200616 RepID=A0ABT5J5K3_RHOTP|nr:MULTISPECIES: DUF6111 family protein [Rhodoplanes]MDC7784921.1 DUF6111 family protein [Rhodoplanes tepidamans]MDC7983983.1 DUF6111 family protein [Rhodoplanes sp. TEM]MDQ0353850.1 hypothetical protein [Rhodoplanes tepidamans]